MQKIYLALLLIITVNFAWSQSDNCSGAITLTNGVCVTGSSAGFTQNIVGCVGNADDDAWYKFVATGTSHSITVTGSATFDAVLQFFSGTSCSALISGGCVDNTLNGQAESMIASGLTAGNTYYVRVYHYFAGSGSSTFTMCLGNPPAAPSNDICGSAINLAVNAACVNTAGTTYGATQSFAPCAGTANDDVWYSFSATNYTQTIQVAGSASMDPVVELYDGTCGALTSLSCTDITFSGGTETVTASGLTPGVTYYFRVYDYYSTAGNSFSVCVSGASIIAGSQPNDDPCNAIQIPAVTADCNNLVFSNMGATPTVLPGSPGAVCENYDNATDTYIASTSGAFGTTSKDVWFKITVPASGNIYITPQPNMGAGWIQDGVMALYRGTCGALATFTCSEDYDFIGGYNDMQPFIRAVGLTPGETVYLRYGGYGTAGNFGFCVQSPTNDLCSNALYICDINGYSATTSPAYKRDHPCNMRGNGEGPGPTYGYTVGINPAGPFGAGGTWGAGSAINDVYIDNNSWVRFTAASPTVSLRVTVYDCWGVAPNSFTSTVGTPKGVQMQIFSTTTACCGFTPVSDYMQNASGSFSGGVSTYTVNANSLITGNDYYVMVDGWAGDICNYNIQAISGVALPAITALPGTICPGQSSVLTAPSGATGYTWEPTGQNTQAITVSPGTQMTYTCFVGGVCGYKQTLTKTVFIYTVAPVSINAGASIVNCGTQTITLTGSGANTYTWSTGNTTTSFTTAPSSLTTYSVIGTNTLTGCTNTAVTTVTVNTVPTLTASGTNTICNGANTTLTVSGTAASYTWSPVATLSPTTGVSVTASPTNNIVYTITGTAANSCTSSAMYSVTVNAKPTVSLTASSNTICTGGSVTLTGGGTATTYTWTGGITDGVAFAPGATTTYTVTGTLAATGCTNQAVRQITVSTTPTITPAGTNTICNGSNTSLTTSGASTYTWSPAATLSPSTGSIVTASPATGILYTITGTAANSCTSSTTYSVSVNAKPTVSSTATSNTICNGSSTTLSGTGANTYTWTNPIVNGAAFSPTVTSTYTVTGTNTLTGCTNTAVSTVTVNSIPTTIVSTSGTITCATPTVNLNSTAVAGATYTWTAPGGSSISGGTANNQNAIGQGSGTYTLNVTSAASCTYAATLATNINTATPTSSATNGTLTCAQTSTVLVGGPASGVTYLWSGPGILGSNTTANITATVVGNYSLVTTNTLTGCSSTASAIGNVTNNLTTPTVSAGSNQTITCAAPSVTLTGNATAGSSFSWSSGSITNTATVGGSGVYILTAMNPGTGCTSTSTVQVFASAGTPNGTVSAVSNSITCTNTTVAISITSTSTPISIAWSGPGITGSTTTPSTTVSQGNVNYTVTLTNTVSLCAQSYQVYVPLNTTPVVATATISTSGGSITCNTTNLTLSSTPTGTNYAYAWTGPGVLSGSNTANPIVNTGGNYTVTITDTNTGCSGITGTTNIAVPSNTSIPTLSLSATSVTTSCSSPNNVVTASSNSNPNTTYTWTAPGTGTISSTSISNPSIGGSGIFTVAITNTVNGCSPPQTTVSVISNTTIPTFSLSNNTATVNCTTPTPGATISSSVTGLSYTWSPTPNSGVNTASPTFTAAGNYTCVVANTSNGCSTNVPMVAVSFDKTLPTATATSASSITCSSTSISISSTITPISNVSYNWSGPNVISGSTSLSPIIGSGGNYVVAMTNTVNGCTGTYTVNVPVNTTAPTLSLAANSLTTTCAAPNATFNASSNAGSGTYTWTSPTGGTLSSNTSSNPTASGNGVFTVSVTNPVNGCVSASQTVSLTADANIPTFILPNNTTTITCVALTPSVSLTSTVSGVTYSWNPSPSSGITTASPTFTAPGSYTCLITNPTNSCSTSGAVVTVSQNTVLPSAIATPAASITCSSTLISISSTITPASNVTYNWSGPNIVSGSTSLSPGIGSGGNYVLAMTNTVNGCTNSYTVNVPTNTTVPTMSLSTNAFTTTCSAPLVIISATVSSGAGTTYSWTAPATGTISNTTISNPSVGGSGNFTVVATDTGNGCASALGTVSITADSNIPTFSLASGTATITCSTPSPSVVLTSTVSNVTYSWSPTPGSGATTASPTFTVAGNYTCVITNTVNNCSTNLPQVVVGLNNITPTLNVTPSVSITCALNTVPITSTVNPPTSTYTWSGTGITGGVNGSSITANAIGVYTLTVTDPINGCTTTTTSSVGTNTTAPTLSASATSSVITCSVGSSTLIATPLTGSPTWVIPGGASSANPVIATVAGDYTATVTDALNGCYTQTVLTVGSNVIPPDANAGALAIMPCNSSIAVLSGTSITTDPVSYDWSGPSAGSITSATNIASPTVTNTGVYTLTVTNLLTGCTTTSSVNVTQDIVIAAFTADPKSGETPLTVNFTDASIGATSYSWNFGNGITSINQDPNTIYDAEGSYTVVLIASSISCSDTATAIINVEDGFTILIPNVFTPNGDGSNDAFYIKTKGVKSAEGYIYNRWGQLLFTWDAINASWDGKASNGENCPDGTYHYLIKVIDKKDVEHIYPGFLLIIK